jgi:hypothetical protein
MTCDTITIELNGEVAIDDFALAMHHFNGLLRELVKEEGDNADIVWEIEKLAEGSALMSIRGVNVTPKPIGKVASACYTIWSYIETQREIPYGERIRREASSLTKVIGKRVTSIRIATSQGEALVTAPFVEEETQTSVYEFGSIEGVVEAMTLRNKLQFTLYDNFFDKPVKCSFPERLQSTVQAMWGKEVIVYGEVEYDLETGLAKKVRDISEILALPTDFDPDILDKVCGIIPWQPGDEEPEDAIRRIREDWRG